MDYLQGLNDKQREAAEYIDGPLLILAGAGSGKTSTMTRRIAYMISEKAIHPYNILAVTFTNKAAKEMRDRVESLVGGGVNMWLLTFHSACLRILRKHADRLGYTTDFTIYDPTDQKTVIKNALKEYNIDEKLFTPAYVLSVISDKKEKGISPAEFERQSGRDAKSVSLCKLYDVYAKTLKKNNAMDFDDLIINTVKLFETCEDVLLEYQNRFRYVMVDEYQDTNYMQYKFIKLIADAHNNICVVGDDDQCIYQWRGADISNILDFEKDFHNTKVIKLEQNYRSYGNILEAAHSVVSHNLQRKPKKLWTDKEAGEKITYTVTDNEKDEARFIAQEIDRLKTKERKYSDFAILYRTNAQSRTFEEALSARDIPYRLLGGVRYYERKEIKDIMSYMKLVLNPDDDVALMRIINEPKRGIGDKSIEKLRDFAETKGISLFNALEMPDGLNLLPAKAAESAWKMVRIMQEYSKEKDNLRVSDIYDGLLVNTGYLQALENTNTIESMGRIENLMEFKSVIYDYEEKGEGDSENSLSDFLERITLISDVDNHDENENAVVLMTMHSAKGLEFPIVFLPGMEAGLFPGRRSYDSPSGMEEERRLCYVGMTRAKERLFMTRAAVRTMYGKTEFCTDSPFMREIDPHLLQGDGVFVPKKTEIVSGRTGRDGFSKAVAPKPFDYLAAAKAETKKSADLGKNTLELSAGDKVNHKKFGDGTVVEQNGKVVVVDFDEAGRKKMDITLAPLKRL